MREGEVGRARRWADEREGGREEVEKSRKEARK